MYKTFISILLILILYGCNSCEKTVMNEDDENPSWVLNEDLVHFDRIILNSYLTSSDELLISTESKLYRIDSGQTTPQVCHDYHQFNPSLDNKPVFNDSLMAYGISDLKALVFYKNTCTTGGFTFPEYLYISQIDFPFGENAVYAIGFFSPIGAFNGLNQFFTVILDQNLYGCLVSFEYDNSSSGINIVSTEIIPFGDTGYEHATDIESFGNDFFIAISSFSYIVHPDGSYFAPPLEYSVNDYFYYSEAVWAFDSSYRLFFSDDLGLSWYQYGQMYMNIEFVPIEDRVFFYRHSDIGEINLSSGETFDIDITVLEGNEITSISKHDDYVYITTLSGMYYKAYNDF